MASYHNYDEIIDNQVIYDYRVVDHIFQPHQPLISTITIPECATQIDLFYGEVIQPTFGSLRYGLRLISAFHLIGEGYCSPP